MRARSELAEVLLSPGFIGALAATDPREALALAERLDPAKAGGAVTAALRAWAAADPVAAWRYALRLPADQQANALSALAGPLGAHDQGLALREIDQVADHALRERLRQAALQAWAAANPAAVAASIGTLAAGLREPNARRNAVRAIAASRRITPTGPWPSRA